MRILTAGESHGKGNLAVLEGFPKGVEIEEAFINEELARRQGGFGRGGRMAIESDTAKILSGMRDKVTLGSPIAVMVDNKDCRIFPQCRDGQPVLSVPRPAHADLAGSLKYACADIRDILERSSARETVSRVAVGAVCKQFLRCFGIEIASFTVSCGSIESRLKPKNIAGIKAKTGRSLLNCIDRAAEKRMIAEIEKARKNKDTLGGVVEVMAEGICPGLGTYAHYDKRLDSRIAAALMSIPAVKGVEIGLGFKYSGSLGSKSHDEIFYSKDKGFYHKTNNSGGVEGGISTGEAVVCRVALKPIATLMKPLASVDLRTKKNKPAIIERSDTCAVAACGVIAEAMLAFVVTEAFLEKFGCDSLEEIKANYRSYLKSLK